MEEDLVDRFGARRYIVRQALVDLEHMGVVKRIPNRSAAVRSFAPDELEDLYEVRRLLKSHAARMIKLPACRCRNSKPAARYTGNHNRFARV